MSVLPIIFSAGLIIGLSVSSGPAMLLLFLGSILIIRKVKLEKAKRLKQKFFNQNRGKLLQQLVSHRSDIAERMIIPLKEIEKATNNFHRTRRLGGGGHGTVYKGILSDLHVVAIKKSNIMVRRDIDEFINEVAILSQINHKNIVKLIGCCLETEVPLLAYEFISNGTLCEYLHKEPLRSIPWEYRLRIATEIGKALAYLHSAISIPVIHRDMKSANILLDDAFTPKVSDFGASRYIPEDQTCITTMVQGTLGYIDPTYYCSGLLTEKSDVYSFGVILIELLTRKMPVTYRSSNGDGLVSQFQKLLADSKLGEILDPHIMDEGGSQIEEVAALAVLCIKLVAEERPTMRQVEMTLEGIQALKEHISDELQVRANVGSHLAKRCSSTKGNISSVDVSRQYSQEEEFLLSARYPR
jgi:serine/threonine protein kinase